MKYNSRKFFTFIVFELKAMKCLTGIVCRTKAMQKSFLSFKKPTADMIIFFKQSVFKCNGKMYHLAF